MSLPVRLGPTVTLVTPVLAECRLTESGSPEGWERGRSLGDRDSDSESYGRDARPGARADLKARADLPGQVNPGPCVASAPSLIPTPACLCSREVTPQCE